MVSFLMAATLFALYLFPFGARGDDPRRNDKLVEALRAEFTSSGLAAPPEPPSDLGVHATCVKFGLACSDAYVDFLKDEVAKLHGTAGGIPPSQAEKPKRVPPTSAGKERRTPKSPVEDNDPTRDVKLEKLQRLRNVYRDKLLELHSSEKRWECFFTRISSVLSSLLLSHVSSFVLWFWTAFAPHVPVAMLLMAVLTWVFFGTHIPNEHICCLRAARPAFAMDQLLARSAPPKSVASLVIERERCSGYDDFGEFNDSATGASAEGEVQGHEVERRDEYWDLVRFSLIEAYDMYHAEVIVLKLRLVLSLLALLMLIWSVISLPLQTVDLQNGGFVKTLVSSVLPEWVPAVAGLHFAWSCVGGLVAFACWEVFAAGEMLCRLNARSATMCDSILKEWSWKLDG